MMMCGDEKDEPAGGAQKKKGYHPAHCFYGLDSGTYLALDIYVEMIP